MQNSGIVIPTKSSKFYNVWVILYKLGVFFIFLLFGLLPFSKPYIGEFYLDLYKFVGLALIFTFLVFRRFKDGSEIKLIFLYFLWLSLARIIDGGILLDGAVGSIFDIIVCLPFLGFAIVIPAEKRLNWLDIIAIIYCAAYRCIMQSLFFRFYLILACLFCAFCHKRPYSENSTDYGSDTERHHNAVL